LSGGRPLAVVDIDGVIADVRHRLHHLEGRRKAWGPFFAAAPDDGVHPEGAAIVETLGADHEIVFVTGRPEDLRTVTETWLDEHGFAGHRLVMRARGDRRPAARAKVELMAELAADRPIGIVVDDDRQVLDAARAAGYPTFHADWERRAPAAEAARHEAQDVEGRT
jgi:phosphoglycolate phosphatase-like HAD superfamily hydrolase